MYHLIYDNWTIPPGTPVFMSSIDINMDASVFPEPQVFDPERWMGDEKEQSKGESV